MSSLTDDTLSSGASPEVARRSEPATPYETIGGMPAIRAIVDRFYDFVEADPAYQALRAMHAEDLAPMRESLSAFLGFWLGGPEIWRPASGGGCVMSLHGRLQIDETLARQWTEAMSRAIADNDVDPALAEAMIGAMTRMCGGMINC